MPNNKLARYLRVFSVGICCRTSHCMPVVNTIAAGLRVLGIWTSKIDNYRGSITKWQNSLVDQSGRPISSLLVFTARSPISCKHKPKKTTMLAILTQTTKRAIIKCKV